MKRPHSTACSNRAFRRIVAGMSVVALLVCAVMPPAIQHRHLIDGEAAWGHAGLPHTHAHSHRRGHSHHHHHGHAGAPVLCEGADARIAGGRVIHHWHYVLFGLAFTIEAPEDAPPPSDDRPKAVRVSSVSVDSTQASTPLSYFAVDLDSCGLSGPVPAQQEAYPPPLHSTHGPPLCHAAELLRSGVRLV